MWQDNNPYGATPNAYYGSQAGAAQPVPLQFYSPSVGGGHDPSSFYSGSGGRSSLEGNMGTQGSISSSASVGSYGGNIAAQGPWWTAFGSGGLEGEPPLLEGTHTL
jgi:protein YIPF5/7